MSPAFFVVEGRTRAGKVVENSGQAHSLGGLVELALSDSRIVRESIRIELHDGKRVGGKMLASFRIEAPK